MTKVKLFQIESCGTTLDTQNGDQAAGGSARNGWRDVVPNEVMISCRHIIQTR